MTAEKFKMFWESNYPQTVPISFSLKHDYPDRWFRIHSLPESKRYAEDEEEWSILLHRQNKVITDLLGQDSNFLLVVEEYMIEGLTEIDPSERISSIAQIPFTAHAKIDLNKLRPEQYDTGSYCVPLISEQVWSPNKFDDLLRDIADSKLGAFFVSIENKLIVAPYDGGVDFILKDSETRDFYKEKYSSWLSPREDGF